MRKVLYIDDDAGLRTLVQRGFRRDGIEVVHAADGESGLKALETDARSTSSPSISTCRA